MRSPAALTPGGVTLQDLSMVMGHSSVAITADVYVHLSGREQAESGSGKRWLRLTEPPTWGLQGAARWREALRAKAEVGPPGGS
jgi:hypothetical protein